MPVGRFRADPETFDEVERRVSARQYPEGALVLGMGVGIAAPFAVQNLSLSVAFLSSTLGTAAGPILGGVAGYLLGHQYRKRKVETHRRRAGRSGTDEHAGRSGGEETSRTQGR